MAKVYVTELRDCVAAMYNHYFVNLAAKSQIPKQQTTNISPSLVLDTQKEPASVLGLRRYNIFKNTHFSSEWFIFMVCSDPDWRPVRNPAIGHKWVRSQLHATSSQNPSCKVRGVKHQGLVVKHDHTRN